MKLTLYVVKKFAGSFIVSLLFFIMMLSLADLVMNLWSYISRSVAPETIGKIMLYYLPKSVWFSLPLAVLIATAYTLSDLYASNELTAIFASGISLFKFTLPLLIIAFFMSIGMFFFDNNLVVPTYAKKIKLQNEVLRRETSLNNDRIVILSEEGRIIYKADYYDNAQKRLFNVFIIFRNEDMSFDCILRADNALFIDGKWHLSNSVQFTKEGSEIKTSSVDQSHIERLTEVPETFRNNTIDVESVNIKEAKEYIRHLEKAGLPSGEAKSVYYKKFTFPFVLFICVFLAIGLSGKTRKNVLIVSIALSVGAAVLFYVLQMMTMIMAKHGVIPPLMGPAFPVVFFIFVSIALLRYART